MLDSLITSKTRIKLLVKFFSNKDTTAYLRSLASEFNESSNSVRIELNRFAEAGLLLAKNQGNTKLYKANDQHPLFPELNRLVIKYLGLSGIVEEIVYKLGDVKLAFVTGDYAHGVDSGIVDLSLVGHAIDNNYLHRLVTKTESLTDRKIRTLIMSPNEFDRHKATLESAGLLMLWNEDENTSGTQGVSNALQKAFEKGQNSA